MVTEPDRQKTRQPASTPADPAGNDRRVPGKIGKYVVTEQIGEGTTGTVYLCHDPWRGKDVALKLYEMGEQVEEDKTRVRRAVFFNEAQLAGKLQHPNILPIYDAGEDAGHCFIVMEYVRGGKPLSEYCQPNNLLPIRNVVDIVFKCAKALDYAHRQNVIHRDIKPGNVLLTHAGDVRIVDFGIAQSPMHKQPAAKGIVGSPSYMAPEQLRDHAVSPRSDLFSLGVVMYELLVGKRPFYGDNLSRLIHQIIYATPVPLHRIRPDLPQMLQDIVFRALEKDPAKRYRSGFEFAADLTLAFRHLEKLEEELTEQEVFNLVRHLPFFRDFSYPEIWEVLRAGELQRCRAGEEVAAEGELENSLFILAEGMAVVIKSGRTINNFVAGDCFGEAAYLDRSSRTASIVARSDVTLLRINPLLLEKNSIACQMRFNKMFLRTLIGRLVDDRGNTGKQDADSHSRPGPSNPQD